MRKTILQVYTLRCDECGTYSPLWRQKAFDLMFCENTPCVRAGFDTVLGRLPKQDELFSGTAENLLKSLSALPETVESIFIAAADEMIKKLAAQAVESTENAIPLQIEPFCYAHLQWGNHRCPDKWFLQRWNAYIPQ